MPPTLPIEQYSLGDPVQDQWCAMSNTRPDQTAGTYIMYSMAGFSCTLPGPIHFKLMVSLYVGQFTRTSSCYPLTCNHISPAGIQLKLQGFLTLEPPLYTLFLVLYWGGVVHTSGTGCLQGCWMESYGSLRITQLGGQFI